MLRRTQADQVVPVFERFLKEYPTLEEAAKADPERIKELLYPLGLSWRADNVIGFIREAFARFGNDLPLDLEALQSLPGVGDYVGAAIICFAGGKKATLIDTNVVRVLGRIFGIDYSGEARRRKDMRELATIAVNAATPAEYHYALLDFAAKVCVAHNPRCGMCPFNDGKRCAYYKNVVEPSLNR